MKTCVITGSFDPVTEGHIYLAKTAAVLFDRVIMAMLINPDKRYAFSETKRLEMLKSAIFCLDNISCESYHGYAVDLCKARGAVCMVRGVRNAADLAYECDLRRLNLEFGGVDTIFILTDEQHKNISSTAVKQGLLNEECFFDS